MFLGGIEVEHWLKIGKFAELNGASFNVSIFVGWFVSFFQNVIFFLET